MGSFVSLIGGLAEHSPFYVNTTYNHTVLKPGVFTEIFVFGLTLPSIRLPLSIIFHSFRLSSIIILDFRFMLIFSTISHYLYFCYYLQRLYNVYCVLCIVYCILHIVYCAFDMIWIFRDFRIMPMRN